eukprot:m.6924 g.6924  ORF g.6924 m.6924 type:complete len:535 (+) comp3610_c0_seq1:211-1815(+)
MESPTLEATQVELLNNMASDSEQVVLLGENNTPNEEEINSTLEKTKLGWRVLLVCIFTTLGGVVFGFDTGVIGGVIIADNFRSTMGLPLFEEDTPDSEHTATVLGGAVAILSVGCFVGSPIAGPVADTFGRRLSTGLGALVATGGGALQAAAVTLAELYAGRFLAGFGVGILSAMVPLYNAEIAPASSRGMLVSIQQLAITFGILLAFVCNLAVADIKAGWRISLWLQCASAALLLAGAPFLPETPRYLVMKGKHEEAEQVLTKLRNHSSEDSISHELKSIQDAAREQENQAKVTWKELMQGRRGYRVMIGTIVMTMSQLTGINAIIYYAPIIFESVGIDALKATAVVGIVNFLSTFIAMRAIDRLGRKALLLRGSAGMVTGQILLVVFLFAFRGTTLKGPQYIIAGLVVFFTFCFSWSWGVCGWVFVSEIFALGGRGKAVGLSVSAMWITNTILTFATPPMLASSLDIEGTFLFYAFFTGLGGILVLFLCPETQGMALEQIDDIFKESRSRSQIADVRGSTRTAFLCFCSTEK